MTVPPATPPLSRALPHRHSISHTPAGASGVGSSTPNSHSPSATSSAGPVSPAVRTTVISVPPHASRESLSMDSGNPSPDTTFTSERTSRSPMEVGSESDSRSLDLDSLSVDDYSEPRLSSESGTTVIHVSADSSLEANSSISMHSSSHVAAAGTQSSTSSHLYTAAPEVSNPNLSQRSLTTLQTSL